MSLRRQQGHKSKKIGEYFENSVRFFAQKQKITAIKIPEGCRLIKNKYGKLVPILIKTPFDFLLAKNGKTICFDCKTIESGNFSFSEIDQNQAAALRSVENQKIPAGYLIFYRNKNKVIFYLASTVQAVKSGSSLKEESGVNVGDNEQINFDIIFDYLKDSFQQFPHQAQLQP